MGKSGLGYYVSVKADRVLRGGIAVHGAAGAPRSSLAPLSRHYKRACLAISYDAMTVANTPKTLRTNLEIIGHALLPMA